MSDPVITTEIPSSGLNKKLPNLQRVKTMMGDGNSVISEHGDEDTEMRVPGIIDVGNSWIGNMVGIRVPYTPSNRSSTQVFKRKLTLNSRLNSREETPGFGFMDPQRQLFPEFTMYGDRRKLSSETKQR